MCGGSAIEAIKKAHRLELEGEVQKRRQTEAKTGDARLEDAYRQHRWVQVVLNGVFGRLEPRHVLKDDRVSPEWSLFTF